MARKPKETPHLRIRIEPTLLGRLEKSAEKTGRTLTGEIVQRMQQSFDTDDRLHLIRHEMTERIEYFKSTRLEEIEANKKIVDGLIKQYAEDVADLRRANLEFERQHEKALLAASMIDVLLGDNKASSALLRRVALELADNPAWSSNKAAAEAMAKRLSSLCTTEVQE
jgi:Arc-like DNA binding dprotein